MSNLPERQPPVAAPPSTMKKLLKSASTKNKAANALASSLPTPPASAPAPSAPALSSSVSDGGDAAARAEAAAAKAEAANLRAQLEKMGEENTALKGQVHLLKFKVDLLVDMVTLANLDCDKLEDELEAATGAEGDAGDDDAIL